MKRVFDIAASVFILLLTLPITILTYIIVWLLLGTPVIFSQVRPGKDCKPFSLLKFRTMTNERDEKGELLPNEKRHTRLGRFLRSTSLDELPGFFNVLKGEMSIVGPRPLKMDYVKLYKGNQIRRHETKPGVTGWAQVNGRNSITFTERFKMDVWYVDNKSFILDMKILCRTFYKVIKRENISPSENIEMAPFDGTN